MNKIKFRKINNEKVKKIVIKGRGDFVDSRPLAGKDVMPTIYGCCYVCARTKMGKTRCICHMIKQCATRDTTVIVFAGTLYNDEGHITLRKYCKKKSIPYLGYVSMMEEGVNVLKELTDTLKAEAKKREEEEEDEEQGSKGKKTRNDLMMLFNDDEDEEGKKGVKRCKYQAPEYIIFLDDLRNELKKPILVDLIQFHRHWHCKLFISSQYANDILPASCENMNYCMLFKGMPDDKLEKLHKDFSLRMPLETFIKFYKECTKEMYNFFYIDTREEKFRRNFDCMIDYNI